MKIVTSQLIESTKSGLMLNADDEDRVYLWDCPPEDGVNGGPAALYAHSLLGQRLLGQHCGLALPTNTDDRRPAVSFFFTRGEVLHFPAWGDVWTGEHNGGKGNEILFSGGSFQFSGVDRLPIPEKVLTLLREKGYRGHVLIVYDTTGETPSMVLPCMPIGIFAMYYTAMGGMRFRRLMRRIRDNKLSLIEAKAPWLGFTRFTAPPFAEGDCRNNFGVFPNGEGSGAVGGYGNSKWQLGKNLAFRLKKFEGANEAIAKEVLYRTDLFRRNAL